MHPLINFFYDLDYSNRIAAGLVFQSPAESATAQCFQGQVDTIGRVAFGLKGHAHDDLAKQITVEQGRLDRGLSDLIVAVYQYRNSLAIEAMAEIRAMEMPSMRVANLVINGVFSLQDPSGFATTYAFYNPRRAEYVTLGDLLKDVEEIYRRQMATAFTNFGRISAQKGKPTQLADRTRPNGR